MLFGCDVKKEDGDWTVTTEDLEYMADYIAEDLGNRADPFDIQDDIEEILRYYSVAVLTGRKRTGQWVNLNDVGVADDRPLAVTGRFRVTHGSLEIDI